MLLEDRKRYLNSEGGTIFQHGSYHIALLYPNPYSVAMSSLGYQVIYRAFNNHPDIACERAVLPDDIPALRASRKPLTTIESGRPVGGANCIAISLAYEPDLAGVFDMLELARIPATREERGDRFPPVILGGPITMSNTLPLSPFADAIIVGDGEPVIEQLSEALVRESETQSRELLLDELAAIPGIYVPARHGDAVPPMLLSPANDLPAVGQIWTPHAELSNMLLIETSRGCPRYCSFCVMRSTAQPMREAPIESVISAMDTDAPRIGFVGAAVSEYQHIKEALRTAINNGKGIGISSLRADRLDDELVELLKAGGYRTMTVASDAPSQAMRGKLKKGLRGKHLKHAAELAAKHGMNVFKMYVIIGLPGETINDLNELIEFSLELRKIVPRVALGLSPFVPKLHTPLGDAEFTPIKEQDKRLKYLRRELKGRVDIRSVSAKWAWVEYRLSQGGAETGLAALDAWRSGNRFADYRKAFNATSSPEREALTAAKHHALWEPAGMR
jgi:radical SAM superfamily enzyme YgiQ (UPF0313 family)